jgi:TPR repeat protein
MTRFALAAAAFALLLSGHAWAGPVDDLAGLKTDDYAVALKTIRPQAEAGDPKAQFQLGFFYSAGMGVGEDKAEAMVWYRKAIAQGYGPAKDWVLLMCANTVDVPAADCKALVDDLRASADRGDGKAQTQLGGFMLTGKVGLSKDPAGGVALIRKAADSGLASAQDMLGMLYSNSFMGVSADPAQSVAWYRKAAAQGDVPAALALAIDYSTGLNGLPKDEAQAATFYKLAAEKGESVAQSSLAEMYENGKGVPKDEAQAFYWYRRVADQGLPSAEAKVGSAYALGKGVKRDYVQAYAWLDAAVQQAKGKGDLDDNALARDEIARHLSPSQVATAKRQSEQIRARLDQH